MFITNTSRCDRIRLSLTIMAALAAVVICDTHAIAATPVPGIVAAPQGLQRIDDYAAAIEAATEMPELVRLPAK